MIDESLKRIPKPNNMYYHYYVTSLAHEVGGNASEPWIAEMLNLLKQKQERNGPNTGSWPAELDGEGSLAKPSGRLGVTAFCLMTLTANRPSSAQPVKD
jgi:hypothetical protein